MRSQDYIEEPGTETSQASYRRLAIARYNILDSAAERDFDNLTVLAAKVFGASFAAISFIDRTRQWFKAEHGLGVAETPIEQSFCAHALETPGIFLVKDASLNPMFGANPLVTGHPHIRFYAGMRVLANDRTPIAAICVMDPVPRPDGLTEAQRLTLQILASQVESLLELRHAVILQKQQVALQRTLSRQLRHMSNHDELTGLPRRNLFREKLDAALEEAKRSGRRAAVMTVDVDHFKQINDSFGHDVGDALLCAFAKRFRAATRKTDTVARLGGDEFGLVIPDIGPSDDLKMLVRSLGDRLHKPFKHNGRVIDCEASIGVAIYPDHATSADDLIKCSDLALAAAKRSRGCSAIFSLAMAEDFDRQARILEIARAAISANELIPHYQAKVSLATGRIVGFEALARCKQAGAPPLLPEMFAHAFSDGKLAADISRQMLAQVLDDIRHWVDVGAAFGHVAINSSATDFKSDDFGERLLDAIDTRGLDPAMIELEITEGVFLGRGTEQVTRALALLSERGVRIALDDFGTGFASLTHLKQFPVDVIKIDRSFVAGVATRPDDATIVRALIGLGKSLGIETVAEGIETVEQASFLRRHGCDLGQGFFYCTPAPAADVPSLIKRAMPDYMPAKLHMPAKHPTMRGSLSLAC
ncbi:MAG: EAL domain-containing protein [Sphingopyxis sp.]|nr:EAL domain-containing protein [Sphingopyxis sp.]